MERAYFPNETASLLRDAVDNELRHNGLRLGFHSVALEERYQTEVRSAGRLHNRLTMLWLVVMVDLFYLPVPSLEPEVARLSAILRFGMLTLLWALYAYLDWRGRLGGWCQAAAASLPAVALVMIAIEIFFTTSPHTAANIAATPLVQLVMAAARLNVRQAACIMLIANFSFAAAVTHCTAVPGYMIPDMILISLAIGSSQLAFAFRVDMRERQVFLLGLQAAQNTLALAETNRALAALLEVDELTGLGNRRCFDVAMQTAWRKLGPDYHISLILADIDHFKIFNDTLGHLAGDRCLRQVSAVLARCVRNRDDTVARYGGEEFALVLPNTRLNDAITIAERVREAVAAAAIPHPAATPLPVLTVSLGVACMKPDGETYARLVNEADKRLYAAKRQGRNCLVAA